ncbi:MAG: hypothetical protein SNJ71_05985 [Bacteroidales bacterium]
MKRVILLINTINTDYYLNTEEKEKRAMNESALCKSFRGRIKKYRKV